MLEQVVWLGEHAPWQDPVMQVCPVQAAAEPQVPLAWQVWMPLPEHCVAPGTHTPVQPPFWHAELTHATAVPHAPLALHV